MTIVVSGYALPQIGAYAGAPAVYGLTLRPGQPLTPSVIVNSSIEQWYAIDFRVKRRRPVTKIEWQLLRQFIEIQKRARNKLARDARAAAKLERLFGTIRTEVRLPYRGDPSGLRPAKRRESRRTA